MPSEVMANRSSAAPRMNRASEPRIGTASRPCTTRTSDSAEATSTTSPIDQILLSMISAGVTGMTSRCSTVPCSRSRMRAAPVRMIDSMVTEEMTSVMAPNQLLLRCGLKRALRSRSTGGAAVERVCWRNSFTSPVTMDCT